MNPVSLVKEFEKYMNVTLANFLGYDEKYHVDLDIDNKNIQITLSTDVSTISAYEINPPIEDEPNVAEGIEGEENVLDKFEDQVRAFLIINVPGLRMNTILFYYDYDSIVIKFQIV